MAAFATGAALITTVAVTPAAAAYPLGFEDTVIAEISAPMDIAWTPDGRILVPTKGGELFVIENDVVVATPAINLGPVMCTNGERALGGVGVHPNFAVNRYVYLYYTFNKFGTCNESEIDGPVNRLSRFVLGDNNIIDPASELVLFDTPPLFRDHHNSGDIEFGKDGFLYVTVGDGGTKRFDWPQDPGRLLGKIVRLTDTGGIPPGNPHTGPDSARCNLDGVPPAGSPAGTKCQEVFSQGLRNPFRFAFDSNAPTTRFYVNDVGQSTWEDISEGPVAGADYGWPVREGPCDFETTNCTANTQGYEEPVHWYGHGPFGAAVTGGAFVPNGLWPAEWDGRYLYADYVFGKIYSLRPGGVEDRTVFPPTSPMIQEEFGDALQVVEMAFGPWNGSQALYYVTRDNDALHRITFAGVANRAPTAVATATPNAGPVPMNVDFDGSASSDPDGNPLTYEWDFEGDGTPDSTEVSPNHTYNAAGTFFATLTVTDTSDVQDTATIRMDPGNNPPVPTMTVPADGATFAVGDTIILNGRATDPDEGVLADSSLTWEVRQHHALHFHPLLDPTVGNNIPIIAPEPEDLLAATNSHLEVLLTATDSAGVQTTISRLLTPRTVDVSVDTAPQGLTLMLDDSPVVTPATVASWENHDLRVDAPDQMDGNGDNWAWLSWSDGGAQAHTVSVPATPLALAATFEMTAPTTLFFGATDDSTIRPDKPDRNYGDDLVVEGDSSSVKQGLFRFDVTGTGGQEIASATMKIFVMNGSPVGGAFTEVTDSNWSQDTVTWNNAPAADGVALDTIGDVNVGDWVDVDVTSAVLGDAPVTINLSSNISNGVDYASSEDPDNPPQLVVELGAPPGPDLTAPSQPGPLLAIVDTPTEVELSWSPSTDNVAVTGYDIYRDAALLDSVGPLTDYEDFSVLPDMTYDYYIVAFDAAGNESVPSNTATVTTPGPDVTPPTKPGNLQGSAVGPTQVDLSWTASMDDQEVFAYDVYRDGGLITTTSPSQLSYQDLTVLPDNIYDYHVIARDAAGNESASSDTATVTTPSPPMSITFTPTDDAYVREVRPDRNYNRDTFEADNKPVKHGLIRFHVTGVGSQPIAKVTLRVFVTDSSSYGGTFTAMTNPNWDEDTVTWNNAPLGDGGIVAIVNDVSRDTWIEIDVTGWITGDGPVSLRISSIVNNGVDYASKEHASGNTPELIIELG